MKARAVLDHIQSLGIAPKLVDGHLGLTPKSKITADLLNAIKENKSDIIRLLQQAEREPEPGELVICWLCSNFRTVKSDRPEPGFCIATPPDGEKWRFPGQRIDCPEYRKKPNAKDEKAEVVRSLRVVPPETTADLSDSDCDGICWKCKTPCTARNLKEQGKAGTGAKLPCVGCAHVSTCSKPLDGGVSFDELCACDGTPVPAPAKAQYPNDQARVKCSHCVRLLLSGNAAQCSASGQPIKDGISLLRTCGKFVGKQA